MPSPLFDEFCTTLKGAMAEHGLSGQELARKSGVHWVTISRILNGAVDNTTLEVADKLLSAAGARPKLTIQKSEKKRAKSA